MSHDQDGHLYDDGDGHRYCLCTCGECNNKAGQCTCPDEDREACSFRHGEPDHPEKRLKVEAYYLGEGEPGQRTLVKAYEGISEIVARESIPVGAEYALVTMEWTPGFDASSPTMTDTREHPQGDCNKPDCGATYHD